MANCRPTIKDVARLAGVSFKTVSRVINGQEGVRDEVRARVRAAIAELGYVVNYSARSLASGRPRTIGVVIPRITDPHLFNLIYQIGEICERQGVSVIILAGPTLVDELSMSNFIGHGIVGALLLISPLGVDAYRPIANALDIPTVVMETLFLDDCGSAVQVGMPCVASDGRRGAYEAVEYLLDLGHRRIGFISGAFGGQGRLRLAGYRDALVDHGLPYDERLVLPGDWTWDAGYELAPHFLEMEEPPTAIFCANDLMALAAMRALHERGLQIPRDVSVLGFDDIPTAALSDPPLTTVRQLAPAMAQTAIDLLTRAMDGEDIPIENHLMSTVLMERASCGPVPQE